MKEKQLPATKYNKLGLLLLIIKDSSVPKITGFGVNPKGIVLPQIPPIAFLWTSCWKPLGGISIIQSHLHPPVIGLGFSSPEEPKFLRTWEITWKGEQADQFTALNTDFTHPRHPGWTQVPPSELAPFCMCWGFRSLFYWQVFLSGQAIWRVVTKLPIILSQKFYQQLITLPVQCTRLPGHQEKASSKHFLQEQFSQEGEGDAHERGHWWQTGETSPDE